MPPVIELRTLGSISLTGPDPEGAESILAQPKRLALLTFLTLYNHGGFVRRDRLCEVFWPEADEAHARNSLNQALHQLRAGLGDGVIEGRGRHQLRLARDRWWCDARAFLDACESDEASVALDLYGGTFLDGFHLPGAPSFDRWADDRRRELERRFLLAAQACVTAAEERGDTAEALRCTRLALTVAPLDETLVRGLMVLLERQGDRFGAIGAFGSFERRLREELDLEPSAATHGLAEAIAGGTAPANGETAPLAGAHEPTSATHPRIRPPALRSARRWPWVMALVAAGVAVPSLLRLTPVGTDSAPAAPTLAVLPFENLSDDPEDRYFADGIHAELIDRLSGVDGLEVRSRSSVMQYRDAPRAAPDVSRDLEVSYLLEASVRRAGDRVRVTALMIDGTRDRPVWSERFERKLSVANVLEIQEDIADRIAGALRIRLSRTGPATVTAGMTHDLAAYEHYLQGLDAYFESSLTNVFTDKDRALRTAIDEYEAAIALDSDFALAWAALAHPHLSLYWFGHDMTDARREQARAAATKALELAPDLPAGHHAMGRFYYQAVRDYERALHHLRLARDQRPGDANIWEMIGYVHRRSGDLEQASLAQQRAFELNPRQLSAISNLANTRRVQGHTHEAIRLYERGIELEPAAAHLYAQLARVYLFSRGDLATAREVLERGAANVGDDRDLAPAFFYLEVLSRHLDRALDALSASRDPYWGLPMQVGPQEALVPLELHRARLYDWMGRTELALEQYRLARDALEPLLETTPEDARVHASLGVAYAGLGQAEAALDHARRAVRILPVSVDAWIGSTYERDLADVLTMLGRPDEAIEVIERSVASSSIGLLTPALLRLDPRWDPLRDDIRFQRLAGNDGQG